MRLFQIDSFTETAFCWPLVGDSNLNGSEPQYAIRYFTPTQEVPLCGHATLASGGGVNRSQIRCYQASQRGGSLRAKCVGDRVVLEGEAVLAFEAELAGAAVLGG